MLRPITIGTVGIRNRICLTGHGTGMGRDFKPDDRQVAYYAERARGEVGLIPGGIATRHSFTQAAGVLLGFDSVLVAGPGAAETGLLHELEASGLELHQAGDCYTPRDVEAAVLEGHSIGRAL